MACLSAALCGHQAAQAQAPVQRSSATPPRGAAHDVISEEAFRKQTESATKMDALFAKAKPLGDTRPNMESSLMTNSLFLFDGEMFTIVPMGAILNLPPSLRQHVIAKPEGTFTFWPNFLKRNAAWLAAKEVTLKMAKGDADAAKAILRETSTDRRVVVSVYKGGPITVLEAAPQAAPSAKSATADPETTPARSGRKS